MLFEQYAVVRINPSAPSDLIGDTYPKTFCKWHSTQKEAVVEAKRLCRKEHKEFVVLKAVLMVGPEVLPVFVERFVPINDDQQENSEEDSEDEED